MNSIQAYQLMGQPDRYPGFIQIYSDAKPEDLWKQDIGRRCMEADGKPLGDSYSPVTLQFDNEGKRKNTIADLSMRLAPFVVLSLRACEALEDMLGSHGEFLDILAPIPGYVGYHVLTCIHDSVDYERSICTRYENGNVLVRKPTFYETKVQNDHIFVIPEAPSTIFVSSQFKERVLKNKLKGFDLSHEVALV